MSGAVWLDGGELSKDGGYRGVWRTGRSAGASRSGVIGTVCLVGVIMVLVHCSLVVGGRDCLSIRQTAPAIRPGVGNLTRYMQ